METAAVLSWDVGIHELSALAGPINFDANGGFANSIAGPVLSGLASLELLKLVTKDDGLEKCVPSLVDSSPMGWLVFTESIPIRSCNAIEKEVVLYPPMLIGFCSSDSTQLLGCCWGDWYRAIFQSVPFPLLLSDWIASPLFWGGL